jgi:type I restriction enzyme R subunit
MEEDPVFYKKISDLIAEAIAEHRAKRISDNDYLVRVRYATEQVRRPKHDDVPDEVKSDDNAVAMYHVLANAVHGFAAPQSVDMEPILSSAAIQLVEIVKDLRVVNWTENPDVQNAMRNRMDDFFFDHVRGEYGIELSPEQIDTIVDSVLRVARARMAS